VGEGAQPGQFGQEGPLASTGPTPGTLPNSASFSLKEVLASVASSRPASTRLSSFSSHFVRARMRFAISGVAICRRLFSARSISRSWPLLASIACKVLASSSGRTLGLGLTAPAKRARISDLYIDPLGLGEPTRRAGEVRCLPGVDHRYRDPSFAGRDGRSNRAFLAAAGFQNYQLGACALKPAEQGADTLLIVGDGEELALSR
jgi:hypothetical protein